jgi:hypothetical protein
MFPNFSFHGSTISMQITQSISEAISVDPFCEMHVLRSCNMREGGIFFGAFLSNDLDSQRKPLPVISTISAPK